MLKMNFHNAKHEPSNHAFTQSSSFLFQKPFKDGTRFPIIRYLILIYLGSFLKKNYHWKYMHYNFYIFICSRSSNYSDLAFVLSCKMVFSFALHGGAIGDK